MRGSLWLVGWSIWRVPICAVALTRAVLFGIRPFIRNLLSSVIQRRGRMVARPLPQGEATFHVSHLSWGEVAFRLRGSGMRKTSLPTRVDQFSFHPRLGSTDVVLICSPQRTQRTQRRGDGRCAVTVGTTEPQGTIDPHGPPDHLTRRTTEPRGTTEPQVATRDRAAVAMAACDMGSAFWVCTLRGSRSLRIPSHRTTSLASTTSPTAWTEMVV